jgi:5,6-dimethylbenzimidazole synthase
MTRGPEIACAPVFGTEFRARLEDLFLWRRDVRRFRADPVQISLVQSLLETAALAPSVGHSQPWRFVSVETAVLRQAIITNFNGCNAAALACYEGERAACYARLKLAGLREAPVHLAVFCDHATEAGHVLAVPAAWKLVAYLCVGFPQEEHLDPELERHHWQERIGPSAKLHRR